MLSGALLLPVSGQQLWERVGQVKSLSVSSDYNRKICVFVFRGPYQNGCVINPKDEDFSLSDEAEGHT